MTSSTDCTNEIDLAYGTSTINLAFEENSFAILANQTARDRILSDAEIGAALESPIASPPLEDVLNSGDSVLLVVSDATRATASAQIVNLLVRRVLQNGIYPGDIAIIFATGIHRPVSAREKVDLLTPFIVQRVRTIDHDAYDADQLTSLGTTEQGTVVVVNRALKEFSTIITCGGIGFHYFAGFTGGRKSICPGLASAATIEATHMLALDFEKGGRRAGVGTGLLDGNLVHEECERIAKMIAPAFSVNSIVDEKGRAVGLFCGDWRMAHRAGCKDYLSKHSVDISSKRDLVVASCGGSPYDINLVQAHKALEMASYACNDGGTIILLAECRDGLGRADFMKWFDVPDSRALEARLRENYEVNGQTAWSLLTKTERFRVCLLSELPDEDVRQMRMIPIHKLSDAFDPMRQNVDGYIFPRGTAVLPRLLSAASI
jgi:nickel-dependent lactate racemase